MRTRENWPKLIEVRCNQLQRLLDHLGIVDDPRTRNRCVITKDVGQPGRETLYAVRINNWKDVAFGTGREAYDQINRVLDMLYIVYGSLLLQGKVDELGESACEE
jgi:hypothetical protein